MKNHLDLTGKVSLITGASSGIGAATAAVFADLGASVAIGYHHNREAAEQLRTQIIENGGRAISVGVDVCQPEEIESMVKQVNEALGPLDVLVNNAGSPIGRQRVLEITNDSWDETMTLNLKSALFCSQPVAASMIERRTGAIVNVVSIAGRTGGEIRLQLELPEGWVVLRVSDNGPGIDPAIVDRLFEPFATTRATSTTASRARATMRSLQTATGWLA